MWEGINLVSFSGGTPPAPAPTPSASIADLGKVLFVSQFGSNATGLVGRIDKPYATINFALSQVPANDYTIYVYDGTFAMTNVIPSLPVGVTRVGIYLSQDTLITGTNLVSITVGNYRIVIRGYGTILDTSNSFANVTFYISAGAGASIIDVECKEIFVSNASLFWLDGGKIIARIDKVTNTLQYIARIQNTSSVTFNFDEVVATPSTDGGTIWFNNTLAGNSTVNFRQMTSTANGNFGAINIINSPLHKVKVTGNVTMNNRAGGYTFFGSGITLSRGGDLEFKGNILGTGSKGITTFGDSGIVGNTNKILFEGILEVVAGTLTNFEAIHCNNPMTRISIKNSIVKGAKIGGIVGVVEVGVISMFGDDNNGQIQFTSSQIINTSGVAGNRYCLVKDGGLAIIDDVAFYSSITTLLSFAVQSVSGGVQNISILSGNGCGNLNISPLVTNLITGTNYIYNTNIIINS